jgi:hypothetical protein
MLSVSRAFAFLDAGPVPVDLVGGHTAGSGAAAAGARARVGVNHHDGTSGQQVTGDLRQRGAGQPDLRRDLSPAERTMLAQDVQDALLMRAPDQRMDTLDGHVDTVGPVEFFRQPSDRIFLVM